jgi:type IV secretion system protein VirB10
MKMEENNTNTLENSIPSITEDTFISGAPQSKAKKKSFKTLILVLVVFLTLLSAIAIMVNFITSNEEEVMNQNEIPKVVPFVSTNESASDVLIKKQAEIKAKELDDKSSEEITNRALAMQLASSQAPIEPKEFRTQQLPPAPPSMPLSPLPPMPLPPQIVLPPPAPTAEDRQRTGSVLLANVLGAPDVQSANKRTDFIYTDETSSTSSKNNQPTLKNLEPSSLKARQAKKNPDFTYLLRQGNTIPCALKTAIDTTLSGLVVCQVIKDVYSANGKTLLIERGSSVFGEQSVSLLQGQVRIFALWRRIDTPNGISIDIDSPSTDELGRSGIPAGVNAHFWERFSGAILFSMIKDTTSALSTQLAQKSSGSNGPTYNSSANAGGDVLSEIIKNSINIPPTGVVNPGELINIMIARDISFNDVYRLKSW